MVKGSNNLLLTSEQKIKESRSIFTKIYVILIVIYLIVVAVCIPFLVTNRPLNFYDEWWIPVTIMSVATGILIFVSLIFISLLKTSKRELILFSELKEINDWDRLLSVYNEPPVKIASLSNYQDWAVRKMIEVDPSKTLKYFSKIMDEEFERGKFGSNLIKIMSYLVKRIDRDLIYEQIFDSLLVIQKEYYRVQQLTPFKYGSSYTTYNPVKSKMVSFATMFGFKTLGDFITFNILNTFVKIYDDVEPNQPIHLKRVAELCRVSEEKIHLVLEQLLMQYPELGKYKEFEMLFIPSKEIVNYETIVDFHLMVERTF
jgi:hypothetical protein